MVNFFIREFVAKLKWNENFRFESGLVDSKTEFMTY